MATTTHLAPGHALGVSSHVQPRSAVPDQGPWLFLAAPFSFGLVVLTVVYLAGISF